MRTVKIDSLTWYDAGSDVNWIDHGGQWARPAGKDADGLWFAIRYDAGEPGDYGPDVACYEIRPDEVTRAALDCIGAPSGPIDEYGDPIPARAWALIRVEAAIAYGEGRVATVGGRDGIGPRLCAKLRIVAAKYLMGSFIGEHPFRWS